MLLRNIIKMVTYFRNQTDQLLEHLWPSEQTLWPVCCYLSRTWTLRSWQLPWLTCSMSCTASVAIWRVSSTSTFSLLFLSCTNRTQNVITYMWCVPVECKMYCIFNPIHRTPKFTGNENLYSTLIFFFDICCHLFKFSFEGFWKTSPVFDMWRFDTCVVDTKHRVWRFEL